MQVPLSAQGEDCGGCRLWSDLSKGEQIRYIVVMETLGHYWSVFVTKNLYA